MGEQGLTAALDRAEQAIGRIERALAARRDPPAAAPRDEALRAKVRETVAELDELIRTAEG
ncbi:MAG: hypothetical protein ABIP91_08725 [Sphingomicrobium sp.]